MKGTPRQKEWYQENLVRERTKRRVYGREFRRTHPEKRLWSGAKNRAKLRGIHFSLSPEDVVIPEVCPILGVPMVAGTRYAPSLDRIVPALGYTKENVWVISYKANSMKNDASLEELERFANWVRTSQLS